jgi:hypothetical protein
MLIGSILKVNELTRPRVLYQPRIRYNMLKTHTTHLAIEYKLNKM